MNINQQIKKHKNIVALLVLLIILSIIAYVRVLIQIDIGAPYDTYDFLANAAEFAGKSIGYTDIRPPFLSFLTSIVFRFQDLSIAPIFYIDAILDVLGAIGLYFLLKLRFNNLNSFLGSLLYFTFPITLTYVGVGFPDLPSISISIWALYLTVLAVKKDSRFFYLSFPLAALSFLTKYNQALIIFPIFLYILINWENIKTRKSIAIGIFFAILTFIPLLIYYTLQYGNPLYPFIDFYGTSSGPVSSEHFDYNTDMFFYIKLLPYVIGNGALIILLTFISGLFIGYFKTIRKKTAISRLKFNFRENYIKNIGVILIFLIFLISINGVSYLLSLILFFFLLYGIHMLVKNRKDYDLDFLFFSWFGTFLIFISIFQVKDIRYFMMILPPFAYFLIRGLLLLENYIGPIKKRKLTDYLTPILIIIVIFSAISYLESIPGANIYSKDLNNNMGDASNWLINYDQNYKSKVIYADLWPHAGWFLQTNIQKMPQFLNNKPYYNILNDYKPTEQDSEAANNFLVTNNAYYYLSFRNWTNLNNYVPLKTFGLITIYKRAS